MAKDDMIELEGIVTESLPNTTFHVDIGNGHIILVPLEPCLRGIRSLSGRRPPQSEAQRSGSALERRGSEANEHSALAGCERCEACDNDGAIQAFIRRLSQ